MKKFTLNILALLGILSFSAGVFTSCSDEPDAENYYTFTGQMMSEYLKTKPEFRSFATIVERAGLMDQLSAYGHYTCFAPNNEAIDKYLASRNTTLAQLTDAECDTIARSHLVSVMFSTSDMSECDNGTLRAQNMMRRNLWVGHEFDADNNTVIVINKTAQIYFAHQDDSVENGIVQQVSSVIENSSKSVASLIKDNPDVSIYYQALRATGLETQLDTMLEDRSYVAPTQEYFEYRTGGESDNRERAIAPKQRLYGFTAFLVPDEVLKQKYPVYFNGAEDNLKALYNLACSIYDVMYPEDVNTPEHSFENLQEPTNPLYRFMAYHLLDRNVQGYNYLTVRDDAGVDPEYANATDWYTTMLKGKMIKVEHLVKQAWVGYGDVLNGYYINRRYDGEEYYEHGVCVTKPEETIDARNGLYFYIDDILKFDVTTRDVIDNCRIRMDFSTIFPEIMTNNMRMNGNYTNYERLKVDDESIGFNYCFPDGYLKGVKIDGSGAKFVYRRPRLNFYSMHGDEMIANGVFDITFELPPFPFEGSWQIRLGCAPMTTAPRGAVQIYYDGAAAGMPLNMDLMPNSPEVYGATSFPKYSNIRSDDEKRLTDFKILKNKGYYRGPFSVFHCEENTPSKGEKFADQPSTIRKVVCTVFVSKSDLNKAHTLRVKNVSNTNAANKEAMFDYLELVPSSVYAVTGDKTEDDL